MPVSLCLKGPRRGKRAEGYSSWAETWSQDEGVAGDRHAFCAFYVPGTVPATHVHNSRKSYKQSSIVSFQKTEVTEGKYLAPGQTVVNGQAEARSQVSRVSSPDISLLRAFVFHLSRLTLPRQLWEWPEARARWGCCVARTGDSLHPARPL